MVSWVMYIMAKNLQIRKVLKILSNMQDEIWLRIPLRGTVHSLWNI